jgi:hypothetical protein
MQTYVGVIAHNVSHVCDAAPSLTEARGCVAERRAAAPRSPRRLPRRRCTYALLCEVAPIFFPHMASTAYFLS